MPELSVHDRPLRADAERNRLKILAAAREVFAARGLVATLDDVAAHAGVGVGTVYRRFPDKDALIDALFEERLNDIAEMGRRALVAEDPWDGFISFMTQESALQARDRGLKQAMLFRGTARIERARATMIPIVSELITRAQQAGSLRADLTATDIPLINMMVSTVADLTRDRSDDVYKRMLQIVFDGLATSRLAPTPLLNGPITKAQLASSVSAHGLP